MKQYLRAGLIGLGGISRVHIDSLQKLSCAKITAVCDIDEEKLARVSEATGAKPYRDYTELLKDENVDIVHVLTPHYLHAPMSIAALKAGKHVLSEKPMASELKDAKAMIEAADEAKTTLSIIFQNRYNASTVALKQIIESGEAGKLLGARASICWHREAPYYTQSGWRGTWEREGGGVLINQSIHTLDLLSYLGGPIKRVKGSITTGLLEGVIEVEDNAHAVFEYENGATGVVHATNNYAINAPIMLEMAFENGTWQLWAEKLFKLVDGVPTLVTCGDSAEHLGVKSYWGASHGIEIEKVYTDILEGRQFEIDARSAFPALALLKGIYKSSATGEWVTLEQV